MEFAEYRQPWETGPHWELKREFLEFYKDNFTEERLLCLAQAYSNIELLQCSYPNQVMLQIHELSKPLQGCKRFRGNGNAQSNHQGSEKQQGKRKNDEPAFSEKFKFIKFCSGNEDSVEQEASKPKCESLLPDLSVIDYESITKAQNFNIFKKLSEEVKKILEFSKENPYDIILSAALHSNVESLIDLKFTNQTTQGSSSDRYYCEFFIGATKIAIGNGENRYAAKSKASENALYILTHLKESPKNNLEEVCTELQQKSNERVVEPPQNANSNASSPGKCGNESLIKLALEVKNFKAGNSEGVVTVIHNCATRLKMLDDVIYKVSQDFNCNKNGTLYLCDLFIKNTLIGQGEGSKIKIAKREATSNGLKYLQNLLERNEIASSDSKDSEEMSEKSGTGYQGDKNLSNTANDDNIREPFILNKELFNYSIKKQFMLFVRSEELGIPMIYPTTVLSFSAQVCRKNYCYNYITNDDGTVRCQVLIDQEVFGSAVGQCRQVAKCEAARTVYENLRKKVYIVKVKPDIEEGYNINRNDMLQLRCDTSQAVSDDNIGCRMLKMMGWSGGGIGKSKGIAEPIRAGIHNFGAGLGYTDLSGKMDMKNLKSEIETLLQEYSKSCEVLPLIFSSDFTKSERKEMHRIAQKYNLCNNSQGKGDSRRLIIKRKIPVGDLLDLIVKSGGSTKKYELIDLSK